MAVIPANQDPAMEVEDADQEFWSRVRGWQDRGWSIGLHGYHHRELTRRRGLFGQRRTSEFAGLPLRQQAEMIAAGLAILRREGIHAAAFVAPSHSFDRTTLAALVENGLTVVSDGLSILPYRDRHGVVYVPMRSWRFDSHARGVLTVGHHPGRWDEARVKAFADDVEAHRDRITDLQSLLTRYGSRHRSAEDHWRSQTLRAKRFLVSAARGGSS